MPTLKRLALRTRAGNQYKISRPASTKGKTTITSSETWMAIFDGLMDRAAVPAACSAASTSFPVVGFVYGGLFCTNVNPVQRTDTPNAWDIKADYQSIEQPDDSTTGNWNINVSVTQLAREETAVEDGIGKPLWNTADVFLPQLPNDTIYDDQIVISWASKNPPPWAGKKFAGKVNDGDITFTICGLTFTYTKYQLRCTGTPLTCDKVVTGRTVGAALQYKITYNNQLTFIARDPDWTWKAPNEGYEGYDPNDGNREKRVHFTTDPDDRYNSDGKGIPSTVPLKMDIDGSVINDDSILWLPADASSDDRYNQDGRFVIPKAVDMRSLFTGLNDSDQVVPV